MSFIWKISVVIGLLLWPLAAWSAFDIEPHLMVREEFTDNLFLRSEDKESDFITTLEPGFTLAYDARLLRLDLNYGLRFLKYLENTQKDETSIKDIQRIEFKGVLFPANDFTIIVIDTYQRVVVNSRRQTNPDNPFVNMTNMNHLQVNPEYRFRRFATFEANIGYRFEQINYLDEDGDDSDSHNIYLNLRKNLNTKLAVFAGGNQQFFQADEEADYQKRDLTAGFDYRISSALTIFASGGNSWIDFKNEEDETELLWEVGATYEPGARWKAEIIYQEDNPQTVDDGLSKRQRLEAAFTYKERFPTELLFFAEKQQFQIKDREDRSIGSTLQVTIPISHRLSADITGDATSYRFQPEDENAFEYAVGLAASYRFKIGTLSGGYRYRARNSDADQNDYQNNLVFIELLLTI